MGAAERLPFLYSEEEAAKELGVSVITIRRYRKSGKIGFIRIARKAKYTEAQLRTYLEQQTCPASDSETTGSNNEKGRLSGTGRGGTGQDVSSALRLAHETLAMRR